MKLYEILYIVGPQEIIVFDANVKEVHGGGRAADSYYFICKTQESENKTIKIFSGKEYDNFAELIEDAEYKYGMNVKYRVSYFVYKNVVYDVEICE